MNYFTANGINQVTKKYGYLIGEEFYFDERGIKHKLIDISKRSTTHPDAFLVIFYSENNDYVNILDFMTLNKLEYNIGDFDTISIEDA